MFKEIRNIEVEVQIFSSHIPKDHLTHPWTPRLSLGKPLNYTG